MAKKRVGRPTLPKGVAKKHVISLRLNDELHAFLTRNAIKNRRSLSAEIEARLDQPFRDDRVLEAINALSRVVSEKGN